MIIEEFFDRVEIEAALRHINCARAWGPDELRRAKGLLRGLEGMLPASSAAAERDRDAARALEDLHELLVAAGGDADTRSLQGFLAPILDRLIEALLDYPERRLASVGSRDVGDLVGQWCEGTVRNPDSRLVPVRLFESAALPHHWDRLDALEETGTRRVLVPVEAPGGLRIANLYVPADEAEAGWG